MRHKKHYIIFAVFAFLLLGNTGAFAAPRLSLEKKTIYMGSIEEGKNYEYSVGIENTGDEVLHISTATPSCDCITILKPEKRLSLAPEEKSAIKFSFDSTGIEGIFKKHIFIYSNDEEAPIQKIYVRGKTTVVTGSIIERAKKYGLFVIIASGLIDGINPCAFTVLVFFISFLSFSGYKRRQVIHTGLAFILAVFLTYFLIGLGIFRIVQGLEVFRRISSMIRLGTGAFAIVLGAISVYDFVVYKVTKDPDRIKLKLPQVVKKQIQSVIREKTDIRGKRGLSNIKIISGAFVTGFLVSLLESVCTGQTYLPTVMFMFRVPILRSRALVNLIIYNFMFIIPLLFILVFGIMGVASEGFARIAKRHLGGVKLCLAAVFFILGISLFIIK